MAKKAAAKQGQLALNIPSLKSGDYVTQTGTVPLEFMRPVKVNDFTTNILATLKMNHKKSTYEVHSRILWSQISSDPEVMKAVFAAKYAIEMIAINHGEKWRNERIGEEADYDEENQMELPGTTVTELEMGFGPGKDIEEGVPQVADAD